METFEDYIKSQIEKGYWRETDLQPIKCEYCESINLKDDNYSYLDGHIIEEYEKVCQSCKKVIGIWSYGNWQL